MLWFQFQSQLPTEVTLPTLDPGLLLSDHLGAVLGSINAVACLAFLAAASALGWQLWAITIVCAGIHMVYNIWSMLLRKKLPWSCGRMPTANAPAGGQTAAESAQQMTSQQVAGGDDGDVSHLDKSGAAVVAGGPCQVSNDAQHSQLGSECNTPSKPAAGDARAVSTHCIHVGMCEETGKALEVGDGQIVQATETLEDPIKSITGGRKVTFVSLFVHLPWEVGITEDMWCAGISFAV